MSKSMQPRCSHGVFWPHECRDCADEPTDEEIATWIAAQRGNATQDSSPDDRIQIGPLDC